MPKFFVDGSSGDVSFYEDTGTTAKFFWDASAESLGIGTTSPTAPLTVVAASSNGIASKINGRSSDNLGGLFFYANDGTTSHCQITASATEYRVAAQSTAVQTFYTNGSERMRIDSSGVLMVSTTNTAPAANGVSGASIASQGGRADFAVDGSHALSVGRNIDDGGIVVFYQAGVNEGSISVSGTAVSYNGGHLARWSRLPDDSKDASIVKGTVMTNLDEMVVWSHETTYWTEDDELPVDEDGNPTVAVGDVKKEAYTEDNEQLNKMAVSSVEGDPNVAGVFVNWDEDDDFNDMNIAMTGDMVIRIAQGVTVNRGDLLMSAGDGTAKPQEDDIVRSKTIAKVTSTHVSHTYDDGSYLVPCVLMAC